MLTKLFKASIAKSTILVYKRAWAVYNQFHVNCISRFTHPYIPLSVSHIASFIAYMHLSGYAPSTQVTYISSIGYLHKISSATDPTKEFMIQKLLVGSFKISPTIDNRLPITLIVLFRLIEDMPHYVSSYYNRILLAAMFSVAFFGLFRIGELTTSVHGEVMLHLNDLNYCQDHFAVSIKKYKHSKNTGSVSIPLYRHDNHTICPVKNMLQYLEIRGYTPGPLFQFASGKATVRSFFVKYLNLGIKFIGLQSSLYKSHSFRIGGASYLAELGLSDAQIRERGRWDSDAFKKYIRNLRVD